jgi:predicted esterase
VATHGAEGRPEYQCRLWAGIAAERAFVLCPRGRATNPYLAEEETRYYYPSHLALAAEVEAAFEALVARYPDEVDPSRPVYAGFSQGASMGALMLPTARVHFARVALVEGGFGQFQEWNVAAARRFREQGAARVLLACGRLACFELAQPTARFLEQGGLETRLLYEPDAGHSYLGPMQEALRAGFEWLVAGDPRWAFPPELAPEPPTGVGPVAPPDAAPNRPEN